MDKATGFGLLIGFGGILFGNWIEGGHVESLMQFTAALIVVSGTFGAVMVSHSQKNIALALEMFRSAFKEPSNAEIENTIKDIVNCTRIVKKESVVSLESQVSRFKDPFFRKIVKNVIDGIDPEIIRDIFETEIETEEEKLLSASKVWMDAGGFSPTIGIIGAVLGLIHVMGNLSDTSKLGGGIAVAFVATVYGVGFANLFFIPIGNKLKKRALDTIKSRQIVLEGALLINSGLSAIVVEQKVRAYLDQK
jgi:chemotaxis protein MotA